METYLKDFTFLTEAKENQSREDEQRTCFNVYYPFDIFPPKGLHHVIFDPVTIFYGGNGSGKSTVPIEIHTKACYTVRHQAERQDEANFSIRRELWHWARTRSGPACARV